MRLREIFESLPDSKKSGSPDFPSVLSSANFQSERYGSLHRYLHSARPFAQYADDHRVQLLQQLEFVLNLDRGCSDFTYRQRDESKFYNAVYSKYESGEGTPPSIDPEETPVTNCGMEPYVEEVLKRMGPLRGKKILEVGGGGGLFGLWMALQGAQVSVTDVSDQALAFARKRESELRGRYADRFSAPVDYRVVAGEHLDREFQEACFDFVFSYAVIHHLETESFAYALNKILKPGGIIFFCYEPFYFWRWLHILRSSKLVKRVFPPGSETRFERRLDHRDIGYFRKYFKVQMIPSNFVLFNFLTRPFLNKKHPWLWPLFKILIWPQRKTKWSYDQFGDVASRSLAREYSLLRSMPFLKAFCGNATLILRGI